MHKRSWMGTGHERIPLRILTVSISVAISYLQSKAGLQQGTNYTFISVTLLIFAFFISPVFPSPLKSTKRLTKPPCGLVIRQLHLWRFVRLTGVQQFLLLFCITYVLFPLISPVFVFVFLWHQWITVESMQGSNIMHLSVLHSHIQAFFPP